MGFTAPQKVFRTYKVFKVFKRTTAVDEFSFSVPYNNFILTVLKMCWEVLFSENEYSKKGSLLEIEKYGNIKRLTLSF